MCVLVMIWCRRGRTAIFIAAKACKLGAIEALIELGADLNQPNEHGRTPIHAAAARKNSSACIDMLAEAGADVNTRDKNGLTPIEIADKCRVVPNIMTLRMHGAEGEPYEGE